MRLDHRMPIDEIAAIYGQRRRLDGSPAAGHAIRVVRLVQPFALGPVPVLVAVLHDSIEDALLPTAKLDRLGEALDFPLTRTIRTLSRPRLPRYLLRDRFYHSRLRLAVNGGDLTTLLIKVADTADNLTSLGVHPRRRQIHKLAEAEQFLLPLARRHLRGHPLVALLEIEITIAWGHLALERGTNRVCP